MKLLILRVPATAQALKPRLEELVGQAHADVEFVVEPRPVTFRGIDPFLLAATIGAGGTLAGGLAAVVAAVAQVAAQLRSKDIVLEIHGNTARIPCTATAEQVSVAVDGLLRSGPDAPPDTGKLYIE